MALSKTIRKRGRMIAGLVAIATTAAAGIGLASLTAPVAAAATCADVDISFARGSLEAQGFGIVGGPFVSAVTANLPGRSVSSYAVVYAADAAQTSAGAGSTDLVNHLNTVAASCSNTVFILAGYSQGATVVDKALGIPTTTGGAGGTVIPAALSGRVASVVAFGNPLGLQRQTIATASALYGARSKDYCNTGDPVCGNGANVAAHLQYATNGSAAAGGKFAASFVGAAAPPTTTPPVTSGPPTTSPPVTSTPPTTAQCITASTRAHVDAGRATDLFGRAYAIGTRDSLGFDSTRITVSLQQNSATSWSLVRGC